eukprot:499142-Prorocentrum_minimum.AAC.1
MERGWRGRAGRCAPLLLRELRLILEFASPSLDSPPRCLNLQGIACSWRRSRTRCTSSVTRAATATAALLNWR